MSRAPLKQVTVCIEKFSSKGHGIGYASKVEEGPKHKVEVAHSCVGDVMSVEIGRKRSGAYTGFFPKLITPGEDRSALRCIHADSCGGCSWQQVSYQRQIKEKQKIIDALFSSMLKEDVKISPILPCDNPWEYRNKMEYTFSQNKAGEKFLGLIMTGGKGRVFSLTECHLTDPWFAKTVNAVRSFWEESSLQAYNMRSDQGTLRNLTLRKSHHTGHRMAMLTVSGHPDYAIKRKDIDAWVEALYSTVAEEEKENYSIFIRVQQILKGQPTQFYEMHIAGPDYLQEKIYIDSLSKSFTFKISPTAFFQPNTLQAQRLYSAALGFVNADSLSHVLDLYAGTSTLGILFSSKAQKVTSVEINPHATFDAEVNKEWNQIDNLTVKKGDVAEVLSVLRKDPSFAADLVVIDPPRSGLDPKAISHLIDISAKQIIYISCNPNTQAENIKALLENGYKLTAVQPVDQFPHTVHIENICVLLKESR